MKRFGLVIALFAVSLTQSVRASCSTTSLGVSVPNYASFVQAYNYPQAPNCLSTSGPSIFRIGNTIIGSGAVNCVNDNRVTSTGVTLTNGFSLSCLPGPTCKKNGILDAGEQCDPTMSGRNQSCDTNCQLATRKTASCGALDPKYVLNTPDGLTTFTQTGAANNSRTPNSKSRSYSTGLAECAFVCKDIQTRNGSACACPAGTTRSNTQVKCLQNAVATGSQDCGNGVINAGEQCDGTVLPDGYTNTGVYSCTNACQLAKISDCSGKPTGNSSTYLNTTYTASCSASTGAGTGVSCSTWSSPRTQYSTTASTTTKSCPFSCAAGYERDGNACQIIQDRTPSTGIVIDPIANATCNDRAFSEPITINGLDDGVTIPMSLSTMTETYYSVNHVIDTTNQSIRQPVDSAHLPLQVQNNDVIYLVTKASNIESGVTTTTLILGSGIQYTGFTTIPRSITSKPICRNKTPTNFSFTTKTDVPRDTPAMCNDVVVSGVTSGIDIPVSSSGGYYRINPTNDGKVCFNDTVTSGEAFIINSNTLANSSTGRLALVTSGQNMLLEVTALNLNKANTSDLNRLESFVGSLSIKVEKYDDDAEERDDADPSDYSLSDDTILFASTDKGRVSIPDAVSFVTNGSYRITVTNKSDHTKFGTLLVSVSDLNANIVGQFQYGTGVVHNGDTVQLCLRSSDTYLTRNSATLTIGNTTKTCRVETTQSTTPQGVVFYGSRDVPLNSIIESNEYQVTGVTTGIPFSIKNGLYKVNDGTYTAVSTTLNSGDVIRLEATSSTVVSDTVTVKYTMGTVTGARTVTTRDGSTAPVYYATGSSSTGSTTTGASSGLNNSAPLTGGAFSSCMTPYSRYFTADKTFSDIQ